MKVIAALMALSVCAGPMANADTLSSQPTAMRWFVSSTAYADRPEATAFAFDDFVIGGGGLALDTVVVPGYSIGIPAYTGVYTLGLATSPSADHVFETFNGTFRDDTMTFDLDGYVLTPGRYWLTAYPEVTWAGPFACWGWEQHQPVIGEPFWIHNPGGYWGYGTDPVDSTIYFPEYEPPGHLLFTITGTEIPEPTTAILFGLGVLALHRVTRRDKSRRG